MESAAEDFVLAVGKPFFEDGIAADGHGVDGGGDVGEEEVVVEVKIKGSTIIWGMRLEFAFAAHDGVFLAAEAPTGGNFGVGGFFDGRVVDFSGNGELAELGAEVAGGDAG